MTSCMSLSTAERSSCQPSRGDTQLSSAPSRDFTPSGPGPREPVRGPSLRSPLRPLIDPVRPPGTGSADLDSRRFVSPGTGPQGRRGVRKERGKERRSRDPQATKERLKNLLCRRRPRRPRSLLHHPARATTRACGHTHRCKHKIFVCPAVFRAAADDERDASLRG